MRLRWRLLVGAQESSVKIFESMDIRLGFRLCSPMRCADQTQYTVDGGARQGIACTALVPSACAVAMILGVDTDRAADR
jgi:hypothetical protein